MLHGFNDERNFYYSLGVFNGDGQNFKNADDRLRRDGAGLGRAVVVQGEGPLHDVEIGGSFWTGNRGNTLAPANQTTQGGFTFLNFAQFRPRTNGGAERPPCSCGRWAG